MAQIGNFIRTRNGFSGRLRTLSLDIELTIVPADHSDTENAPNYRIHAGDARVDKVGPAEIDGGSGRQRQHHDQYGKAS